MKNIKDEHNNTYSYGAKSIPKCSWAVFYFNYGRNRNCFMFDKSSPMVFIIYASKFNMRTYYQPVSMIKLCRDGNYTFRIFQFCHQLFFQKFLFRFRALAMYVVELVTFSSITIKISMVQVSIQTKNINITILR